MEEQTTQINVTPAQPVVKGSNGLGLAGFIVALIGLVFCWVPILGSILLTVGFILALIALIMGIVKKKKLGLAIAGLIISCAGYIIVAIVAAIAVSALSSYGAAF